MKSNDSNTISMTCGPVIRLEKLLEGIADFLMTAFFVAAFIYYFVYFGIGQIRLVLLVLAGAAGFLNYAYKQHVSREIFIYIAFAAASFLVCAALDANYSYTFSKFICTLSYMGIALNLLSPRRRSAFYEILFYVVSAFVLYRIHVVGIPVSDIIQDGSSRNYISIYVLFFFLISSIARARNGKKISLVQSLVLLVVSFSAYGRGGMLTALALVFGLFLVHVLEGKSKWKLILLIVVVTLAVAVLLFWNPILSFLRIHIPFFRQFEQRGISGYSRVAIWRVFLRNNGKSLPNLLLGSDPSLVRPDENMHNSFLQMYSSFGLLFFMLNVAVSIYALGFYYKNDKGSLLLFAVLLIRAFTDRLFYHGINECVYYYFVFMVLTKQVGYEKSLAAGRKWRFRLSAS